MNQPLTFKVIFANGMGFDLVNREVYSQLLQPGSPMGRGRTLQAVVEARSGSVVYKAPETWNNPPRRVFDEGLLPFDTYASAAACAVVRHWVTVNRATPSVVALSAAFRWPHLIEDDRRFAKDLSSEVVGTELMKVFGPPKTVFAPFAAGVDDRPRRRARTD